MKQKVTSPLEVEIGKQLNITLKYSQLPLNQSGSNIQDICSKVILSNSYNTLHFIRSTQGDCILETRSLKFYQLSLKTNQANLFRIPVEVSFNMLGKQSRTILANLSNQNPNTLNIIIDPSIEYFSNDIYPFTTLNSSKGLLTSPRYQYEPSNPNTILKISLDKLNIKQSSSFNLADLISNISTLVLIVYFSSLFLFFQMISKSYYTELASRLFILKYNINNQTVYQNINPSLCSQCETLNRSLNEKAIQKVIEKLDISNLIKQIKNLEILVNESQARINIQNLKKTITTMNPYEFTRVEMQKILEYMQLENIQIDQKQHNIFSSPLTASIARQLTHGEPKHFLEASNDQKEKEIQVIQPVQKQGNIILKVVKSIAQGFNWLLQQLDLFSHRVGFFFDEHSESLVSSFSGFFTTLKIWLFFLFCFSNIYSFLSYQPHIITSSSYPTSCFNHTLSQPLYFFIKNTDEYLSLSEINNIATISYNTNNKSYIISPNKQRNGGVFEFPLNISSCETDFSIEIEYVCSSNTDCDEQIRKLFDLDFYLSFPETRMAGDKVEVEYTEYKFKYQQQSNKLQNIQIIYSITENYYDTSVLPYNHNSTITFSSQDSKISYREAEVPITVLQFKLSNRVTNRQTSIIQIDQFLGTIGSIWILLGGLLYILEKFIRKLQMKIEIQGETVTWWKLIKYTFSRVLIRNERLIRIQSQGEELFSIQKLIQRMSIIQNYMHSCQSQSHRIILNTYMKKQLQPNHKPTGYFQNAQLPDVSTISTAYGSKISNALINHHPHANPNPIMRHLYNSLSKLNIFSNNPGICFKGKSKISSKTTKLFSIGILLLLIVLIFSYISQFGQQTIIQQQISSKDKGMTSNLSQQFQLCINFTTESVEVSQLINDYLIIEVQQDSKNFEFKSNGANTYCLSSSFKEQSFSSSNPFTLSIKANHNKLSPDFEEYFSKILRGPDYQLCITNYYHTSHKHDSIYSLPTCLQNLSLKSRVREKTKIGLHWNSLEGVGFYNFNWMQNTHQYQLRNIYSETDDIKQFSRFEFHYVAGVEQVVVKQSIMKLFKRILGLIIMVLLLKPIIRRYNETKYIMELSKQLFLVEGEMLELTFYDISKIMFLSLFKLRKFMGKRNRILMRSYLNTRKLLSYKDFITSLTSLERILKNQTDPSFSILLKTYIKPEIYLQQNLDRHAYNNKIEMMNQLKESNRIIYEKLKKMGLNDDQILSIVGELQKEQRKKNIELNRRVQFFKEHLGFQ